VCPGYCRRSRRQLRRRSARPLFVNAIRRRLAPRAMRAERRWHRNLFCCSANGFESVRAVHFTRPGPRAHAVAAPTGMPQNRLDQMRVRRLTVEGKLEQHAPVVHTWRQMNGSVTGKAIRGHAIPSSTADPRFWIFRPTGSGGCACDSRTPVSKTVSNYQWCRCDSRVQKGELCDDESVLTLALRPDLGALARERQWHYFRSRRT
jgi:hypothetical protein